MKQPASIVKLPVELAQLLREKGVTTTGSSADENGKLPPELIEIVRKHFNADESALPMSKAEAENHREKLMEVRSTFYSDTDDQWHRHSYSFCEH